MLTCPHQGPVLNDRKGVGVGSITPDVINALRYHVGMLVSFQDRDTERLAQRHRVKRFGGVATVARRKLRHLDLKIVDYH
jgi:hypothetical protein